MTDELLQQDTRAVFHTLQDIERVEAKLLELPQIECPLTHSFAPGVYLREIFMPKGAFIIGQKHKTEHFNIVLSGSAAVLIDGIVKEIKGPCSFVSKAGVRKMLHILEDMRWMTVHATNETDVEKLEAMLITKSRSFLEHHEIKQLRDFGGSR